MNKAELVNKIAEATGQSKVHVQDAVAALLHSLTASLAKGDRVTLVGFGTFERRQRKARTGVNPQNPDQKLRIDAAKVPAFRAGQELKNIVDGRAKLAPLPKAAPAKAAQAGKTGAKKTAAKPKAAKKTVMKKGKKRR